MIYLEEAACFSENSTVSKINDLGFSLTPSPACCSDVFLNERWGTCGGRVSKWYLGPCAVGSPKTLSYFLQVFINRLLFHIAEAHLLITAETAFWHTKADYTATDLKSVTGTQLTCCLPRRGVCALVWRAAQVPHWSGHSMSTVSISNPRKRLRLAVPALLRMRELQSSMWGMGKLRFRKDTEIGWGSTDN